MVNNYERITYTDLIGKKIRKIYVAQPDSIDKGRKNYTLGELCIEDWDGKTYIWTYIDEENDEDIYVYLTDVIGSMKELQGYDIINIDMYKSSTSYYDLDRIRIGSKIIYEKNTYEGIERLSVSKKCTFDRDMYTICCMRIQTLNGNIEAWTIGFAYEDCDDPEYVLYKID